MRFHNLCPMWEYTKIIYPCQPTLLELHTNIQSSWIKLRGTPLKVVEQDVQKEVKKKIMSQRPSEVLALSSKILAFLSYHTILIRAKQTSFHNTLPLLVFPTPLYEILIMVRILLGGTQSICTKLNSLCHSPELNGQCKKMRSIISPLSIHNKQTSGLRALQDLLNCSMSQVFTFLNATNQAKDLTLNGACRFHTKSLGNEGVGSR